MIKRTTCLSDTDWSNLNGNEIYVTMLRHKIRVELPKDSDSKYDIIDYVKEVPEHLVYYKTENVYGHVTVSIYFENPVDMQNFIHFYNTDTGLKEIKKEN